MNNKIEGIINISGPVGVGKSAMAYEYGASPERTIVCDWDEKRPGIDGIEYHDFMHILWDGGNDLDMGEAAQKIFHDIEPGKFEVLVLDGWEKFVKTLAPFVKKHADSLRDEWPGGGKWKQLSIYGYTNTLEAAILGGLQKRVPLIFVINHLDYMYINDVRTTKKVPNTRRAVIERSRVRLFLGKNSRISHPCPSALVLKGLSMPTWNEEKSRYEMLNVLPPRLDVRCLPNWKDEDYISVWDIIRHYQENPVLSRDLEEWETLDAFETAQVRETLTEDEQEAHDWAKKLALVSQDAELNNAIKELHADGLGTLAIHKRLKDEYDVTPSKIASVIEVIGGIQ